jgi:hypothetical protein
MGNSVTLDFSKAQPITLDFSKAQPMPPANLQTQPWQSLPQHMEVKPNTLATRIKHNLKLLASGGKEVLPAAGATAAVALTPETGGLSDLLLPVLSAMMGGAAGTSAKQAAARELGEDSPKTVRQALTEDVKGGVEQSEYEMGGRALDAVLGRWAAKGVTGAARKRLARLTAAMGATGKTADNIEKVLSDMDETVKTIGAPKTPRGFFNVVKSTADRLDREFNQELVKIGNQRVIPMDISNRIRAEITPDMAQTVEGRAEMKELRAAALEYERPWTYNQLNSKRMTNNNRLIAYYKGESQSQSAALSAVQTKIMKAVRDGSADIVYSAVDKIPNSAISTGDAALLKQKQGALWDQSDQLDKRVGELRDAQLVKEGQTFRQKFQPSAYASTRNVHGYVRGLGDAIPGGGPEKAATAQIKKGFNLGPTNRALSRQRLILATPLADIIRGGAAGKDISNSEDSSDQ